MTTSPALTEEEKSILRSLAGDGSPLKDLWPPSTHGRLALYGLVDETPQGWVITPHGKHAIDRAPTRQSPAATGLKKNRRESAGKRLPNAEGLERAELVRFLKSLDQHPRMQECLRSVSD